MPAVRAQDQLFPRGQWSRRLISWVARIIHPTEVRIPVHFCCQCMQENTWGTARLHHHD